MQTLLVWFSIMSYSATGRAYVLHKGFYIIYIWIIVSIFGTSTVGPMVRLSVTFKENGAQSKKGHRHNYVVTITLWRTNLDLKMASYTWHGTSLLMTRDLTYHPYLWIIFKLIKSCPFLVKCLVEVSLQKQGRSSSAWLRLSETDLAMCEMSRYQRSPRADRAMTTATPLCCWWRADDNQQITTILLSSPASHKSPSDPLMCGT